MIFDNSTYGALRENKVVMCMTPTDEPQPPKIPVPLGRRRSLPTMASESSVHTSRSSSLWQSDWGVSEDEIKSAARKVKDAILGFPVSRRDSSLPKHFLPEFLVKFWRTDANKAVLTILVLIHCSLLIWELPANPSVQTIPGSAFIESPFELGLVELTIVLVYVLDLTMMISHMGFSAAFAKKWNITYACLCCLFLVDIILSMSSNAFYGCPRVSWYCGRIATRPLRSIFLVCKIRKLRQLAAAQLKALLRVFEVLVLAIVLIVFYAIIGIALFAHDYENVDSDQYRGSFSTFGRSSLSLTVLLTTENFPDIFYPAIYGSSGPIVATLYFLTYFILGVWVLFNLILAVIFDSFQFQRVKSVVRQHVREGNSLLAAFEMLSSSMASERGTPELSKRRLPKFRKTLSHDQINIIKKNEEQAISFSVFQEFIHLLDPSNRRSEPKDRVVFYTLSRPGTNLIYKKQWLSLLDVLSLKVKMIKSQYYTGKTQSYQRLLSPISSETETPLGLQRRSVGGNIKKKRGLRANSSEFISDSEVGDIAPVIKAIRAKKRVGFLHIDNSDVSADEQEEIEEKVIDGDDCQIEVDVIEDGKEHKGGKDSKDQVEDTKEEKTPILEGKDKKKVDVKINRQHKKKTILKSSRTHRAARTPSEASPPPLKFPVENRRFKSVPVSDNEKDAFRYKGKRRKTARLNVKSLKHQIVFRERSALPMGTNDSNPYHRVRSLRNIFSWNILEALNHQYCVVAIQTLFLLNIYANAFVLCLYERIQEKTWVYKNIISTTSAVGSVIYLLELLWSTSCCRHIVQFTKDNTLDALVCVLSIPAELALGGRVLAVARSFRVLRVITSSKRLHKLVRSIIGSVGTVLWLLVLLLVVFYVFVVIGMQLFSYRAVGKKPYQEIESFDTFWKSMLSLFQVTTTNNWNDVMFTVLPETHLWYSMFFISFYFLVCMVVLNVVSTLIIQEFGKNQEYVPEESWVLKTKHGVFEITRSEPWAYETLRNAMSSLRNKELLDEVQQLLQEYGSNGSELPDKLLSKQ
eukprot:CAMPEP_0167750866 /NCGR_PEP_ID=MMETSP0110_2-20121227/6230_1 /TAXON_ID=629695 /ORGANISM="Gymnochlora sp., Strain CCMP2014" /LENGTH=1030 /DNA_ID=CAMNT_0007636237 /DNA_START=120 /DNA_END=3212 /DNA_ORIENTATION=+